MPEPFMDDVMRNELMDFVTPRQWMLVANLFDRASFEGKLVDDAYEVRQALRELINHPEFKRELSGNAAPQASRVNGVGGPSPYSHDPPGRPEGSKRDRKKNRGRGRRR